MDEMEKFEKAMSVLESSDDTAILIDGPATYILAQHFGISIDYGKLLRIFRERTYVRKAYFFTTKDTRRVDSPVDDLIHWLSLNEYITCVTEYDRGDDGQRRENIDVQFSVKAINLSTGKDPVNHLVLFTGAGRFVPLVEYLDGLKKRVTIVSSLNPHGDGIRFVSQALRKAADSFIDFYDIKSQIQMDQQEDLDDRD